MPWCASQADELTAVQCAGLLHKKEITTVEINTPTFRALQLLVDHGRSAVAVVDSEGRLITNLSSSDLRCAPVRTCVYIRATLRRAALQPRAVNQRPP